jgi:SAM-dependent methyltransferase
MSQFAAERARAFYAQTYDVSVSDWPGEMAFYRELAAEALSNGWPVLELACGTGRVAIRLAQDGVEVVGLDLSSAMLDVAREKSAGMGNLCWVQGDMRSFELGRTFGLVIIPGHAFQNLTTAAGQVGCLQSIGRHLDALGILVVHLDHQDVRWLGDLMGESGGAFEAEETFCHPKTGRPIRASRAWSYERSTQTATVQTIWEEIDADGQVTDRWESGPIGLHCVFRFEMEHLLARTGFEVEAVYGSFFREELTDESEDMVWVARRSRAGQAANHC